MITAETMMVDPTEIVIDMPVDEENIKEKMESMKQRGIIQPVTIWLAGMRIIDGFHRTQAAINLGWDKIPCYVVDCDEDAFWDARIQSAKQHHKIEIQRLSAWLFEAWSKSYLSEKFTPSAELSRRYPKLSPNLLSLMEAVWVLEKESELLFSSGKEVELSSGAKEVQSWLKDKAQKWGMSPELVGRRILSQSGSYLWTNNSVYSDFKHWLTFGQLLDLLDLITLHLGGRNVDTDGIRQWIAQEFLAKPQSERISVDAFLNQRKDDARELRRKQWIEQQEMENSEQGRAEDRQRRIESVVSSAKHAVNSIKYIAELVENSRDFAAPVAACISDLTVLYNELFPGQKMRIKNIIKVSLDELSAENAALKLRIASLERALNSKTVVAKKIKNASIVYGE